MSDISVPGIRSRFGTEKLIEDIMKLERISRDRSEKNVENLQVQRTYWQDLGRRITALRDSARFLYSFQNPFNERTVNSSNPGILTGTATREASEQEYNFTVKQIARADRFLSDSLDENFRIDAGTYTFSVDKETVSFQFRGGTLREFTDMINRRGRGKIAANLVAIQSGKRALLIESRLTGEENRLVFSDDAKNLGMQIGMLKETSDPKFIPLQEDEVSVLAGENISISFDTNAQNAHKNSLLQFEISTELTEDVTQEGREVQSEFDKGASSAITPGWTPLTFSRTAKVENNMQALFLNFTDGSSVALPDIADSEDFSLYEYKIADFVGNKTVDSLKVINQNSHRNISIRNIQIFNPDASDDSNIKALNPISEAQDAIVFMEGIEIRRPDNTISDLVPGVTISVRAPSNDPVKLAIEPDRDAIKDAIISMVANYNRLMADINVLTRNDERVIQELSYLSADEQTELRNRMGVFSSDSMLVQFRTTLQRTVTAPYPISTDQDFNLLARIGIGTDVRRSGSAGYDPARLRGYLEIDEKVLDTALENDLVGIQRLFGFDTTGDFIVNSGVAFSLETVARPYTEIGGIISLKTGTIDSRISQETRRIETMDRQLAAREAALKSQYAQMENAFSRMERMTSSLDQFTSQQNNRR